MAITQSDIKLMESQELSDEVTGGGLMTVNEVQDGVVNNLFSDISRLDRTLGRVSLRKAYAAVQTDDNSEYYGAHAIVAAPATDPAVDVTLFSTDDATDKRQNAQEKIESYVIRSTGARADLFGVHPNGISVITLISLTGSETPKVGDTIDLVENYGEGGEFHQFLKLTSKDVVETEFLHGSTVLQRDLTTYELTEPLDFIFHGGNFVYNDISSGGLTTVLKTTSSASAEYYGIRPVSETISALDTTAKVSGIYAQVTPTNQSETVLSDAPVGGYTSKLVPSGNVGINQSHGVWLGGVTVFNLGTGLVPNTFLLTGSIQAHDVDGVLVHTGGFVFTSATIDYVNGVVTVTQQYNIGGSSETYHKPAVSIVDISDTDYIDITAGTRSLSHVKTLRPIPSDETLVVEYMALGNWYALREKDGILVGDTDGVGAGTLNKTTGTVAISLAALPDVGTKILYKWGGGNHYEIRDDAEIKESFIFHTVPEGSVKANSLTITWTSGGITKTAVDNGVNLLTGDASGGLDYNTGAIHMLPAALPDANSSITYDYDYGTPITEVVTASPVAGIVSLILANAGNIDPSSVTVAFSTPTTMHTHRIHSWKSWFKAKYRVVANDVTQTAESFNEITDDGVGGFDYDDAATVTYTPNSNIQFAPGKTREIRKYEAVPSKKIWITDYYTDVAADNTAYSVSYYLTGAPPTTGQSVIAAPDIVIRLCPTVMNQVVPKSVLFSMGGGEYSDNNGDIYLGGSVVGSIDYKTAIVTLTSWDVGSSTIAVKSLLTQYGNWTNYEANFRTAGYPLRPASFYVSAFSILDGVNMYDTANQDGVLATARLEGTIDVNTGTAQIKYGVWDTKSGNEAEDWYDVLNLEYDSLGVETGRVWHPDYVNPATSIYNAVVFSSIPVNPDIVGINPARLPSDGRVPIFKKGGVAVIHETTNEAAPNGLVADQSFVVAGSDYDLIELYDQNVKHVGYGLYTVDLATSTVTMGNPLDLSAYSEPLVAYKRKEDMLTISDVQINGQLSFASQISNAYTLAAYISSAMLFGDLASRYNTLFDQATWSGIFSDVVSGGSASGTYDELTYPLALVNSSAVEERWAIVFINSTTFDLHSEKRGVILTGQLISSPLAPINPITGAPFFTMAAAGFGAGWSTGNAIRFNTRAANAPIWINRTTMPSDDTLTPTDNFIVQIRGDAA